MSDVNEKAVIEESIGLISLHLDVDKSLLAFVDENVPTFNNVRESLTQIIAHLLDHDLNKLLNAFYRIDINEKKVAEALTMEDPAKIPETLADMILEREMQKAQTRIKYKNIS